MKKNGLSHIRRWLWFYAFLVLMTTLASFIFVYNEISSLLLLGAPAVDHPGAHSAQALPFAFLSGTRIRVLLLLTTGFLLILLFTIFWMRTTMRQINRPIRSIQKAVYRLAQGQLNETVAVESADEFGQIGAAINELAANLQELLLYIWKQTGQCIVLLEGLKHSPDICDRDKSPDTIDQVQELTEAIESLRDMAKSYVFYDVRLDGDKTLAIRQPGNPESIPPASS